jgi:chemotaxis protein methyltransferase CheR
LGVPFRPRMRDADCVQFLQWALPRLELRWAGFRKVRRQVCRRISRRLAELGLSDGAAYRTYIEGNADEWDRLDRFCRITISRFWRDPAVFESLRDDVLPAHGPTVSVWSAGCASGEEPYSLVLAAAEARIAVRVLATDVDAALLDRARTACYPESSLRGVPPTLRARAFDDGCLRAAYREPVEFLRQDLRTAAPAGPFDLVLCRNIVFTYFAEGLQAEVGHRLARSLRPGGALVVGAHEAPALDELEPWPQARGVWRRRQPAGSSVPTGSPRPAGCEPPAARRPPPQPASGSPPDLHSQACASLSAEPGALTLTESHPVHRLGI